MQRFAITTVIILLFSFGISSQSSQKAFYIGHSLSDQIPDMVRSLALDHESADFDWVYQSIPGAPLRWQWDRKAIKDYTPIDPHYYGFYDTEHGLPSGEFDVLVLTESVPRYGDLIEETYAYADSFYRYAKLYNPDTKIYLYEDWHCILSGTPTGCHYDIDANPWRQRIEDDLPMWESVVDTLNMRFADDNPVCLIPAAQGLAQVYDSIYAGAMPGLNTIEDIFTDDIHLSDVGKYFVACVHFATIFETSPEGLTNQLKVWWGGDFDPPSVELAAKFQQIAWKVATEYPRSCIGNDPSSLPIVTSEAEYIIGPNPTNDFLHIMGPNFASNANIYSISGKLAKSSSTNIIDVSDLESGIYFISIDSQTYKFIKN